MSISDPEGWTISEYKSFKVADDDSDTSTDEDSDDDQHIVAKSQIIRRLQYKKIVYKENLLPE